MYFVITTLFREIIIQKYKAHLFSNEPVFLKPNLMKNIKNLITAFICLFILYSCDSTRVFYQKNDKVYSALMGNDEPYKATILNAATINMGNWRLDDISVSPDGKYLALASSNWKSPITSSEAKLEIYDLHSNNLKYTYDTADLKNLITPDVSDLFYLLHPHKLDFQDKKTLVVQIQPYSSSDGLPQDVVLKIDLNSNKALESKFVDRGDFSSFGIYPAKTDYNFEIINGVMHVNGSPLNGIPTGLEKNNYDAVTY